MYRVVITTVISKTVKKLSNIVDEISNKIYLWIVLLQFVNILCII